MEVRVTSRVGKGEQGKRNVKDFFKPQGIIFFNLFEITFNIPHCITYNYLDV